MGNLHISLIQTDLYWEDKFRNLEMLEKKIAAVEAATQIVVLPEMFTTGFSMQPKLFAETMEGPTIEWMIEQASLHKIILTGSIIIEVHSFPTRRSSEIGRASCRERVYFVFACICKQVPFIIIRHLSSR